jgi:hypothetical protein
MKHAIILCLLLVGCPSVPDRPPGPYGAAPCERAYARAVDLGCPPKGPETGTWVGVCKTARANGQTFNVGCFLQATTCTEVDVCGR